MQLTPSSRNASAVLFCCIQRMRHRKRGCCGGLDSQNYCELCLSTRSICHILTRSHTKKKAVSANLRLACVLIARPFCLLVGTPDVNAHISRSALSLRYCVSEAEYSSEVFPLSVFISGALHRAAAHNGASLGLCCRWLGGSLFKRCLYSLTISASVFKRFILNSLNRSFEQLPFLLWIFYLF